MTTTDGLTDMVRSFVAAEVRPAAEDLDATERFPAEIYARMGELGPRRPVHQRAPRRGRLGAQRREDLHPQRAGGRLRVVLAVTDPARRKRGGMSMFLVDTSPPGVRQAYHEKKMGQRASQVGGFVFTDVRLPADALLGGEGEGFGTVMSVLEKGRLGIAALANGICRAALDTAREHALSRQQFGKPIAQFQAVAFSLADMATDHAAARQLIEHGADLLDRGVDAGSVCSVAKLFASEASIRTTSRAVQILGGSGFIRGVEAERLYRDARITTIYEGTSEVQRMIISRALLR